MKRWMPIVALVAALPVAAEPPAHHHYMVGVRANTGKKNAAMLHVEAGRPGLDLALARVNAAEMHRLSIEIGEWVDRTEQAQTDEENLTVAREMEGMSELAGRLTRDTEELLEWTAAEEPTEETRRRIVARCSRLFADFHQVLLHHKAAENKLGIDTPPDPPSPDA